MSWIKKNEGANYNDCCQNFVPEKTGTHPKDWLRQKNRFKKITSEGIVRKGDNETIHIGFLDMYFQKVSHPVNIHKKHSTGT